MQVSRVFPRIDAKDFVTRILIWVSIIFITRQYEENNPSKVLSGFPDAYVDPAGRGGFYLLIHPIYDKEEAFFF